jgi:dihydropteroate synthase
MRTIFSVCMPSNVLMTEHTPHPLDAAAPHRHSPPMSAPPPPTWAGLTLDRPRVMAVLNVTPDSFSDGGRHADPVAAGLAMAADGADIIDVGGESTRPGAAPVPPDQEQARILPVIRALAAHGILVSVDTRNAATMRAAHAAGAAIVNDVSGLAHDPAAAATVAGLGCPVVLMHMRGTPADMTRRAQYADVIAEVTAELAARRDAALTAGIRPEAIALDPGIGFAKRAEHSIALLRGLRHLARLGHPLLVGVSRKSFIGTLSQETQPDRRLGGSLAAGLFAVAQGAAILRVHDVRETEQALRVWQALLPDQAPAQRFPPAPLPR